MAANPDFELFRLEEEHEALREAIRSLSENQIAPYAAEVDEQERFPQEALDALV
ncbi:MAG TPA: acyl-CoA dehydrogenase family protein, partial [Yaniella sp.]